MEKKNLFLAVIQSLIMLETDGRILSRLVSSLFLITLVACVTGPAPKEDYALAKAALDAARAAEAQRLSSGYWNQAEDSFRKAKILYNEREYEEAKTEFIKARMAAEKAENSARLIKFKNGEVL
jgi:hypothetical protein